MLPHWSIPWRRHMTWHPIPSQYTDTGPCYPLMCEVITTFLSWKFSAMRILCSHASSSWKMKPEPTATIPKGITTGYNENIMQMQSQTRWPSTPIDLISVIFSRTPTSLNWYVDLIWIWYAMIFACFYSPILQTLLDISF